MRLASMHTSLTIVLLSDTTTHENLGRALHALLYAKQAREKGMDVELIFDGGGVEWAVEMAKKDHKLNGLYEELRASGVVKGVCGFCSAAFSVKDALLEAGDVFLEEDNGHPNIGARIAEGRTIITL